MPKLPAGTKIRVTTRDDVRLRSREGGRLTYQILGAFWAEFDGRVFLGCKSVDGLRYRYELGQLKEDAADRMDGGSASNIDCMIQQLAAERLI